jgi:hypothetical protein
MIEFLIAKMHDARFMTMLLAAIAASATAYTLIMPLLAGEGLSKRMKAVASERERSGCARATASPNRKRCRCGNPRSSSFPRWWKIST